MTLSQFIEYASYGCAMSDDSTNAEYEEVHDFCKTWHNLLEEDIEDLNLSLPEVNTLYGYDIKNLAFIAAILQKENIPPEKLKDLLTDLAGMARIVIADISDTIQRAIENQMEDRL